jgi:nicotinamidase-related amidase
MMMPTEPTLIVIDVQQAFDHPAWGDRNNPAAERNIAGLLDCWRGRGAPIIHVRHRSASAEGRFRGSGEAIKPEAQPLEGETVIQKSVNSAFIGTDLEDRLRQAGAETIVIAGLTTDHCCSTTARMGANLGFYVWFVSDATATFDRTAPDGGRIDAATMHRTALASLSHEFAEIIDTTEAIRRLSDNAGGEPS